MPVDTCILIAICEISTGSDRLLSQGHTANKRQGQLQIQRASFSLLLSHHFVQPEHEGLGGWFAASASVCLCRLYDEGWKNAVCPLSCIAFVSSRSKRKLCRVGLRYLGYWSHPPDSNLSTYYRGAEENGLLRGSLHGQSSANLLWHQ